MPITAAIKFSQGSVTDVAGNALVGVADGSSVTASNGDNTGVGYTEWELLDVPYNSLLAPGVLAVVNGPTNVSFTPTTGVPGTYQLRLTVKVNPTDPDSVAIVDVRDFIVPNSRGWYIPAFNSDDNTFNYAGHTTGWKASWDYIFNDLVTTLNGIAASVPSTRRVDTTGPLQGGGALSGNLTLSIAQALSSGLGSIQLSGDLGGTATSPLIAKLQGVTLSNASPTTGQVLAYDSGSWAPTTLTGFVSTSTYVYTTTPLSGGGALTGDLTLAVSGATTSAVGVVQLAGDLAGTATSVTVAKINGATAPASPSSGQTGQALLVSGAGALAYGTIGTGGITAGAANTVLTTNSGATVTAWALLVDANIATGAAINPSKIAPGTANYALLTNSGGTLPVWGLIADANVSATASLSVTKIAAGSAYQALTTNATPANGWQTLTLGVSSPFSATNSGNLVQGTSLSIAVVSNAAGGGIVPSISTANTVLQTTNGTSVVWATVPDAALTSSYILASGTRAFTGSQSIGGFSLTSVADPVNPQDAATKNYVDTNLYLVAAKMAAKCATTASITLSGLQTVDGVSVSANDRVLVKNQATPSQNGIYAAQTTAWTRTLDASTAAELLGLTVYIIQGTTQTNTLWANYTPAPITVGTTGLTFAVANDDSSSSSAASVGTANAAGSSPYFSRMDHVHGHGSQTVGTFHAAVNGTTAGFVPAVGAVNTVFQSTSTAGTWNTYLTLGPSPGTFAGLTPVNAQGTTTGSFQAVLQNSSSGTSASTDFIATADTGNATTNYIDVGINSSAYSNSGHTITGALDGYLYASSSNLAIGTATASKNLKFFTGGTLTANLRLTVADGGVTVAAFTTAGIVHNSSAGLLSSSLIGTADITPASTTGYVLTTTAGGSTVAWAAPGGSSSSYSPPIQSFALALLNTSFNIYNSNNQANGVLATCAENCTVNSMQCYVYQSTTGSVQMAIYDAATGVLVAHTTSTTLATGILACSFSAPVSLSGGTSYYLAIMTSGNGSLVAGRNDGPSSFNISPEPAWTINNLSGSLTWPSTLPSLSTTTAVPWIAVLP